jgi:hypothetical protein
MNCTPGDLAICIRGAKSCGRVVRIIRPAISGEIVANSTGMTLRVAQGGNQWLIEGEVFRRCTDGVVRLSPVCNDSDLRPIRDSGDDAKDEMLRPLPKKETA